MNHVAQLKLYYQHKIKLKCNQKIESASIKNNLLIDITLAYFKWLPYIEVLYKELYF